MESKTNAAVIALYNVQKRLYDGGTFFTKDGNNPHFNKSYLTLPALLGMVVPELLKEECVLIQGSRHSDNPDIAIVTTRVVHIPTGDEWLNETDLPVAKLNPQDMGKAITYGRRYGLEPIFGIPTKDDDGNQSSGRGKKEAPKESIFAPYTKATGFTEAEVQELLKHTSFNTPRLLQDTDDALVIEAILAANIFNKSKEK